jgi:hypothetical protein
LSSTLSHASVEEEKYSHTSHSETGSIASGRKSSNSESHFPQGKTMSKVDKLTNKYLKQNTIQEENQSSGEDGGSDKQYTRADKRVPKKIVHFGESEGHIELKDLSEKDFVNLIEGKN